MNDADDDDDGNDDDDNVDVDVDDDADDEVMVTTKSTVSRPGDGCDEEIPKRYRSREARSEFCQTTSASLAAKPTLYDDDDSGDDDEDGNETMHVFFL